MDREVGQPNEPEARFAASGEHAAAAAPISQWCRLAKLLDRWLLQPHDAIEEIGEQYRARLLSALIFILALSCLQSSIVTRQTASALSLPLALLAGVLFVGYLLSRRRRYYIGSWITVFALSVSAFVLFIQLNALDELSFQSTFIWLVLPVLLASMYFSMRGVVALAATILIAVISLPFYGPQFSPSARQTLYSFLICVFAITITITHYRNRIESLRLLALNKKVEQARRAEEFAELARQRAEDASVAKSQFLATMSHEIRTPMNAVIGMTSLLLDTSLSSEQHDFVRTLRESGNGLLHIINDILDLSKLEAQQVDLEIKPFDPRQLIESSLKEVAPRVADKQLELTHLISDEVPGTLIGDEGRLRQILLNLLSNAVKFTEHGEIALAITTAQTEQQHQAAESCVLKVSVRDTGVGIAAEHLEGIFELFSQVDSSRTRKYQGTGLGLAISKRLVQLMGGDISVESTLGQGTQFQFTVHLKRSAQPDSPEVSPPQLPGSKPRADSTLAEQFPLRILLAEDNVINQKVILTLLKRRGYRADVAADGNEAVEALKRQPYDLILMDVQMPNKDGLQATMEIRSAFPTNRQPYMIAITAQSSRQICLDAGMNDYIEKPLKVHRLLAALKRVSAELQ